MKKNSFFVNISRGEIVDENALIKNLKSKKITCAAVDVVKHESGNLEKNKLIIYARKNENLIITPHIAGLTYDSEYKAAEEVIKNLNIFLND